MKAKFCFFVFASLLMTAIVYAQSPATRMIKGSVGSGGQKTYGPFPVSSGGTSLIHLIFDNPGSDLDLAVGVTGSSGFEPIAFSLSGIRQFETLFVGIPTGNQFFVQVISDRGPSAFRFTLECPCTEDAAAADQSMEALDSPEFQQLASRARALKRKLSK